MATSTRTQNRPAVSTPVDGGPSRIGEQRANGASRVRADCGLTFNDVLLSPSHSTTHPRDVRISSRFTTGITLNVPFVSAAMDTVTESEWR